MLSTTKTNPINEYGIAHAENLYTLAELVNHQIKKGFQPCIASGVMCMQHGETIAYVQVMVKYAGIVKKSKPKSKPHDIQSRNRKS